MAARAPLELDSVRLPRQRLATWESRRLAVERIVASMREDISGGFPLQRLADVARMSPFHLHRVFTTGPRTSCCRT